MAEQLQMLWPEELLDVPPVVHVPDGYELRTFRTGDEDAYCRLMAAAGFEGWNTARLQEWLLRVIPDGLFLVESAAADKREIVATAMATHHPLDLHPFGGGLGWVAGNPEHKGKGLGMTVCAAVTARFIRGGYRRIYLKTDDWRLPAIKIYLKLGYQPFLFLPDMETRWKDVCEKLDWPFAPRTCPSADGSAL